MWAEKSDGERRLKINAQHIQAITGDASSDNTQGKWLPSHVTNKVSRVRSERERKMLLFVLFHPSLSSIGQFFSWSFFVSFHCRGRVFLLIEQKCVNDFVRRPEAREDTNPVNANIDFHCEREVEDAITASLSALFPTVICLIDFAALESERLFHCQRQLILFESSEKISIFYTKYCISNFD